MSFILGMIVGGALVAAAWWFRHQVKDFVNKIVG